MHQHPRPSPRSATPATNPSTNPERTNNSRDQPPSRTRSSVDLASYTERAGGEAAGMARNESAAAGSQDRENTKLNQIIQVRGHFRSYTWCNSADRCAALSHQSGVDDLLLSSQLASGANQERRNKTEQMGKSLRGSVSFFQTSRTRYEMIPAFFLSYVDLSSTLRSAIS